MRFRLVQLLALLMLVPALLGTALASDHSDIPLLVLLTETGEERDDLPVLALHPDGDTAADGLSRGLPGMMLRLYRLEQQYLHEKEGTPVEPVYVLLSNRQGGFAREGFFLDDVDKRHAGYVDVMHSWPVTGAFGAMDQLVPHELFHVMRRQLAGEITEGYANQVHSLGVRTDRVTAFNEGCAEHFQAIAFEHPDADSATRALGQDELRYDAVLDRLRRYERELVARVAVATRLRMGFLAWFSNDEDVLRYFAIRDNAFAREPVVPDRLLNRDDPYAAYLIENIAVAADDGRVKPVSRMVATEGVVATLFYRWAMHADLQNRYRDDAFYAQFGTTAADVRPLENVYLKLVHVLYAYKPMDALEVIDGYRLSFPDEADIVDAIVKDVFLGQSIEVPNEIWLANSALQIGTTVFDQFRGLPRMHTFDLNAASLVDLVTVPGVDLPLARAIQGAAPYESIDDLGRVPGVGDEIIAGVRELQSEMDVLVAEAEEENVEDVISIQTIITPFIIRAVIVLLIAFIAGAILYRLVRRFDGFKPPSIVRVLVNGFVAALIGLIAGWLSGAMGMAAILAVTVVFGIPAALWRWRKTHRPAAVGIILAAWAAAAVPAAVLVTPWL